MTTSIITRGSGVSIAGRQSRGLSPAFTRASTATNPDTGATVAANEPRFVEGRFGKAVLVEEGTANLLPENQRSIETDITGFVKAVGTETLSRDVTERWHGAASLKVIASGSERGVATSLAQTTPGTTYTFSAWVKGSGSVVARVLEYTAGGAVVGYTSSSAIVLTSSWQRIGITRAFGATGAQARCALLTPVGYEQAITLYTDGLQLEAKPYATSFVDGTRAQEALKVALDSLDLAPNGDWTIEGGARVMNMSNGVEVWSALFQMGNYYEANQSEFEIWLNHNGYVKAWSHDNKQSRYRSLFAYDYAELSAGFRFAVAHDASANTYRIHFRTKDREFWDTWALSHANPIAPVLGVGSKPNGGNNLGGSIEGLRLHRRALSDEEIAAHAAGDIGSLGDCYHYPFDGNLWPAPGSLGAVVAPSIITRPGKLEVIGR